MKALLSITLIVLTVLACKKDEEFPIWATGDTSNGSATASRNGLLWSASAQAHTHADPLFPSIKTDSILEFFFETRSAEGYRRENLFLTNVPRKPGLYVLVLRSGCGEKYNSGAVYSIATNGGDGGAFHGYLNEDSSKRFIEIISIDETSKEVVGKFDASFFFSQKTRKQAPWIPEEVSFTDGTFKATILD